MEHNLHDLETKGFVVLKNFFNNEDVSLLLDLYRGEKEKLSDTGFANPRYNIVTLDAPNAITSKIESILKEISATTDLCVDSAQKSVSYYDTDYVNWKWHQDLEPYLIFQDSYNAINFWFPLVKPDPDGSGLSLVPMDRLIDADPTVVQEKILRHGGKGFWVKDDGTTEVKDHVSDKKYIIDVNINEIMETPNVVPGDVIAFRYDVLHKTQPDAVPGRISASIRCYNSQGYISRNHLISSGGSEKSDSIEKIKIFSLINKFFDLKKVDIVQLSEISEIINKKTR